MRNDESIGEIIAEKLADFKAADSNGDGHLMLEEVEKMAKEKNKFSSQPLALVLYSIYGISSIMKLHTNTNF